MIKIISMPIAVGVSVILARYLGPENFGKYAFVMALVPLIALPVSGGLPPLLTREVAKFSYSKQWTLYRGALRASHIWVLLISSIILLGYWGLSIFDFVAADGKWGFLSLALWLVPLSGLAAIRSGTIRGLGMPAYAEIPGQVIYPATVLTLLGLLVWVGELDIKNAIIVQIVGATIVFLIATWMFIRVQPEEGKRVLPEYEVTQWKKALLPFSMIAFVGAFNSQIGIIIIGVLSFDEQVSAMRVAERAGQFVAMSLMLVNMIIAPYIVRAYKEGDRALLENLARKSARGSFIIAFPIALIFVCGGEPLIKLVFGEAYAPISYWPMVIVVAGQLVNVFFGSVGYFLSMSGHQNHTLKGQALSVVINVLLCIVLVPRYGAVGAACSVFVSLVIWNAILAFWVAKKLKIRCAAL